MKKYILLLAVLAILPTVGFAQKEFKNISVKTIEMPLSYIQYATDPLGDDYKTYRVALSLHDNVKATLGNSIAGELLIEGFEEVDTDGDLLIQYSVPSFNFTKTEVLTPDQLGGNQYAIRIFYTYRYTVKLIDQKTQKVLSEVSKTTKRATEDTPEMWSESYRDKSDMDAAYKKLHAIKKEIMDKLFVGLAKGQSRMWSSKYGVQNVNGSIPILRIYEKDYYESYFNLTQAKKLQAIFRKTNLSTPPAMFRDEIEEFVKYSEELTAKIKGLEMEPKAANTIAAMNDINIGWIYMAYDDPDKAIEYGEKALAAGELAYNAKSLIGAGERLKSIFKKNGVTSRYEQK